MSDAEWAFDRTLSEEQKADLTKKTQDKLSEMLGVEVDSVMADYVIVMVNNKKPMKQIASELIDFIGDDSAQDFVKWLRQTLPVYQSTDEAAKPASKLEPSPAKTTESEPAKSEPSPKKASESASAKASEPKKRVVSLSSGSSRGTMRSLTSSRNDSKEALARRSQRFGVVEKPKEESSNGKRKVMGDELSSSRGANKRKAQEEPSDSRGKKHVLGPPINSSQAELDRRSKRRKGERIDKNDSTPDASNEQGQHGSQGMPPNFSNYPTDPYGQMMFYPPPYGNPNMMPYMGYPPRGNPMMYQGNPMMMRPPRPAFQNRTWVNPNAVKSQSTSENSTNNSVSVQNAGPRPGFQNKTWVRPDANGEQEKKKEADLDASLPLTPPDNENE